MRRRYSPRAVCINYSVWVHKIICLICFITGYSCQDIAQEEVPLLLRKGIFIMESRTLNMCVTLDSLGLHMKDCKLLSNNMLWKWGSGGILFNIGNSSCMGLNITPPDRPLEMFECDSKHIMAWQCSNDMLIAADHYRVVPENGKVVAKKQSEHKWHRYMSHDESFCDHYSQEVYTLRGNSMGRPCSFPFKFNNKWYHECTQDGRGDIFHWCSTTVIYEQAYRWGLCPSSDNSNAFWEEIIGTHASYQFNFGSLLSWERAHFLCQAQGGDLLSILNEAEQAIISGYIKKLHFNGDMFWIGLNQLSEATGWQWSDGAPLSLVNWKSEMWKYYQTQCESDWTPYNRYCYKLNKQEYTWEAASDSCHVNGSELISVTSLAHVEFVLSLLKDENSSEAWIGLSSKNRSPSIFQWSDGSSVSFTDWHKHEPNVTQLHDGLCVAAQRTDGRWKVKNCAEKMYFICKKEGQTDVEHIKKELCKEGWERHGTYCYKIDDIPRTFEQASSGYYCSSPLATIKNRFEQAFIASMISNKIQSEDSYVWIALQDQNNTGEYTWKNNGTYQLPVTFTNWNKYQPKHQGGCVAMRTIDSSGGRWEVKDCRNFKAKSLCKKAIATVQDKIFSGEGNIHGVCSLWESEPYLDHCYMVFHHEKVLLKRTWEEAEEFCQGYGGHLVSFAHIDEENFLTELLETMFHQHEDRQFWIGFNKRNPSSEGSWEWSDGAVVVSPFLKDMSEIDGTRNCAAFKGNKTVVSLPCDSKLEWICKTPKGSRSKYPEWHSEDVPWFYFRGTNYFFYDNKAEWPVFEFVCSWMRSQIVTIQSPAEQAFIQHRIKKYSREYENWWIGIMAENVHDGYERWRDGSPVVYSNWKAEQKISFNPQCAFISSRTGQWGLTNCSDSLPSICKTNSMWKIEKKKKIHHVEDDKNKHESCPVGWLYYGYKCFFVHKVEDEEGPMDWVSASAYCQAHEGTLVNIESEIDQAFIVMQLFGQKHGFWIHYTIEDYVKWENGTFESYSNWSRYKLIQFQGNESDANAELQDHHLCALMSANHNYHLTGKWFLENCTQGYGFVCEKPGSSPSVMNGSDIFPVDDILQYGNKMYRIISGNMTWFDAYSNCQKYGADLVSLNDEYHQAFLTIIVNRLGYSHWIGFFISDNGHNFEWIDGSMPWFTAWETEVSVSDGNCVFMDIDGYWRRTDCYTYLEGAACLISNKTKLPDNSGKCLETWISFQNYCYSISTVLNHTDFNTAQNVCEQQGSSLLTILDEDENAFIVEELESFNSISMVWLSRIISHNSTTVWLDGTLVDYSNWITNDLEKDHIGDRCVSLRLSDGAWLPTNCNERRGFICKTHKDYKHDEIQPVPTQRTNHAIIPIAVVTSVMVFFLVLFVWYLYNKRFSCTKTDLFKLYYEQSNTQATDAEDSILITGMESTSGSVKELN
ncbi:secretory phospholipase A2 receptor [Bombina bombina]|uniref:secretory phospholipase A2 receptor n=1 Tax=Bombina bombina TaxID=8345 RepID=UPI00235B01E0|nr:secretory phospholipase A2 receptor [Bombina bombina]